MRRSTSTPRSPTPATSTSASLPRDLAEDGVYSSGGNRGKANGLIPFDYNNNFTAPNWGIYPSNVGLLQLFASADDAEMYDYSKTPPEIKAAGNDRKDVDVRYGYGDTGTGRTRQAQFMEFFPARMGDRTALPLNDGSPDSNNDGTNDVGSSPRNDLRFATLGELVVMGQTRFLRPVGQDETFLPNRFNFTTTPFGIGPRPRPFRDADSEASLQYHGGGFLRTGQPPTPLERVLLDGLVTWAGNYTPNPAFAFDFMPLGQDLGLGTAAGNTTADKPDGGLRATWAALFKTADPQYTTFFNRLTTSGGFASFRGKTADFPISPRAGLVTRNGVTQVFTPRLLALAGGDASLLRRLNSVPFGMPAYDDPDPANAPARRARADGVVPPVKASLNTSAFDELWRGYFNVMVGTAPGIVHNQGPLGATPDAGFDAPPVPKAGADAFDPAVLRSHADVALPNNLTREQMVLLRSAISAVNTMDLRDIDRVYNGETQIDGYPAGYTPAPDPDTGRPAAPGLPGRLRRGIADFGRQRRDRRRGRLGPRRRRPARLGPRLRHRGPAVPSTR